MVIGTSASLISTGVFLRNEKLAPHPSEPSAKGPPPAPPPTGPIDAMIELPVLVLVFTFMMLTLLGEAGRRSGMARQKAPITASCAMWHSRLRMPTAAGLTAFMTVPSGMIARVG